MNRMFLDNFQKKIKKIIGEKYYTALNLDDETFQFIELKKEKNYYLPVHNRIINSNEFITTDGIFKNKKAIEIFKKIFKSSNNSNIVISSIENKKLENEIISTLKIAGFKQVVVKKITFDQILPLLIKTKNLFSRYPQGQRIFNAIFLDDRIYFYLTQNGMIKNKTIINNDILDYDSIQEFIKSNELDEKEVYISGNIETTLDTIKEMFYLFNFKTHITDVWQNILDTRKKIPNIFFLESHKYIKVITLALPALPKIKDYKRVEHKKNTKNKLVQKDTSKMTFEEENEFQLSQLSSFQKKKEKENTERIENIKEKEIKKDKKEENWIKIKKFFLQEVPDINLFEKKESDSLEVLLKEKQKKIEKIEKIEKKKGRKERKNKWGNGMELKTFRATKVYYLEKKDKIKKALNKKRKITSLQKLPKLYLPKKKKKIFLPKIKTGLDKVKTETGIKEPEKRKKEDGKKKKSLKTKIINFLNKGIK